MRIKKITAILPTNALPKLEEHLLATGVPGVSIDRVRGFGHRANYFSRDLMLNNMRVEIYIAESKCDDLIQAIVNLDSKAHVPSGILTVENVETMINLNTGKTVLPQEL